MGSQEVLFVVVGAIAFTDSRVDVSAVRRRFCCNLLGSLALIAERSGYRDWPTDHGQKYVEDEQRDGDIVE